MRMTPVTTLRKTALLPALIATGLFAGCGGAGESAADAAAPMGGNAVEAAAARESVAAAAEAAPADFEGTMQQVIISLGAGAVRQVVGSNDLETVLAFSPDRLIKAVHDRSEEHTSELQSLMRISYAVFCLKKKKIKNTDYRTSLSLPL